MGASLTFDQLLQLVCRRGLLDVAAAEDVAAKQSAQRYRLEKEAGVVLNRRGGSEISPAELLASFRLPAKDGGVVTEERVMQVIAEESGRTYLKIDPLKLDANLVTSTLSRPFASKHRMLPIERVGTRLRLATDDPNNLDAIESVRSLVGGDVEVVVSSKTDILRQIREIYGFKRTLAAAAADLSSGSDLGNLEQLVKLKNVDEIEATDQHIVNAVEYMLHYAFEQRASDIHVEPKRENAVVRLRIDGVLHDGAARAEGGAQRDRQPHQDHGAARHRREAAAPGRAHQDAARTARSSCACRPCRWPSARSSCCASSIRR
jgi:general secretion pathway protein E